MKKIALKLFTLVLLFSFMASPAIGQTASNEAAKQPPPEGLGSATRPEPELLPQEILDEFKDGMTIEEFLVKNQGPIPNALLEYADIPVVVIVQLEQPTLIEHMKREGLEREDTVPQKAYLEQIEDTQSAILNQITAGRSGEILMVGEPFKKVLNGFMLRVPASVINDIRKIDGVKSVTRAPEYEPTLANSVPLINGDGAWKHGKGYTGEGVTIAVIDTGIDYTHAMLGGLGDPDDFANNDPTIVEPGTFPTMKVIGGYDFAGTDYNASDDDNNIPEPDYDPLDEYGHGTHVASIAAGFDVGYGSGVAPDALLYAVKIFGKSGSTNLTLHAIEWAMDPKGLGNLSDPVDVINMSLGSNWGPADETEPEFIAVENASAIGVVVVSSAGNAGNSSYIVGSPSSGDSAISVAASTTGFQTSPYIEYMVDTETHYIPYTTSYNPFTTTITANLVDVAELDASAELCDITSVAADALANDIALIKRGGCNFSQKINNAEALGAVAAVIYNNIAGIISMDTTGSTLPAGSILQSDGVTLKDLAPIEISIGPDSNVRTFVSEEPPDTIASFSSRGPRGFDSKLKPEITAPGVAIFAADMGTGSYGASMGGTSMAAPHVAGVAALMKEAKTDWSAWQIKSAMMNTAVDLADPVSAQVPRQGAGRVDALEAVKTNVVAYGDPKLISLSWGVIEISEDYEDTQTITLQNLNGHPVNLDIDSFFTSNDTGATISIPAKKVILPPYSMSQVEVTLSLDASMLPIGFGDMEEYYGYVTFDGKDDHLRVPFYFVPRPYTTLTEVDAVTEFDVTEFGYVDLQQSGPVPSSLWPYPVSLISENSPDVLDGGDLRYVGMDYGWYSDTYGDIFVPAFAMWGDVHTNQPFFNEIDMYIDANRDGTPEAVNFNYNYGWFSGGQNNTWVVVQVDFTDGNVYLGSPYTIYADFNSGFQEWYLPAAWQYVVDKFDYQVASFDWNGMMDYAGKASFDITKPPLSWWLLNGTWTDWLFNPHDEMVSLIVEVFDLEGYEFSDIAGVMLVDYHGQPGAGQSYFWPLKVKGISHLQVAHLAPFAEDASVTITINDVPALMDFDYGDSTKYIPLPAGEYDIAVIPTGETEPALEATVVLDGETYYTALAVGDDVNQDLDLLLLEDDLTAPAADKFHLRLGHLAPFAAGGATADIRLQDGEPILENVNFSDVTDFIPLDAGTYDLKITTPGGDTTLIDPLPVTFAEGDIISAFATGEGVNQPLGVYGLPVDELGFFLPLATYLKVAHLAPFAEDASVTITLNGDEALTEFGYGDSTTYIALPQGEYDVAVTATGATDPAIEALGVMLETNTYYTAIAIGDGVNQDLNLQLLEDDLTTPETGKFHLRLGHLAPFAAGDATADIRHQDGEPILENVDFSDVTDFLPLDAGTYDLKITTPGGDVTLIDPLPVTFAAGDIISAFATGEGINQPLGVYALPVDELGFFLPLGVEEIEPFMYYLPLIMNQ